MACILFSRILWHPKSSSEYHLREQRYFSQHYGKYMFSNQKKLLITEASKVLSVWLKYVTRIS